MGKTYKIVIVEDEEVLAPLIFIQEAIYDLIVGWISFLIYETII